MLKVRFSLILPFPFFIWNTWIKIQMKKRKCGRVDDDWWLMRQHRCWPKEGNFDSDREPPSRVTTGRVWARVRVAKRLTGSLGAVCMLGYVTWGVCRAQGLTPVNYASEGARFWDPFDAVNHSIRLDCQYHLLLLRCNNRWNIHYLI